MHPHAAMIERFYQAFQQRNAEAMVSCYHADVVFSDPVFQRLLGDRARGMWRMLARRSEDLALTYRDITADDQRGTAYWEARYTFSQTGRTVHNKIHSAFQFQDGKIVAHHDTFDLWRWAGMALGPQGQLLGWTPFVRNAIRTRALDGLDAFMRKESGQPG